MTTTATTTPSISRTAADALALMIHETIRPDWTISSTALHIGHAATTGRTAAEVTRAALAAAENLGNRSPAIIPAPGAHWGHASGTEETEEEDRAEATVDAPRKPLKLDYRQSLAIAYALIGLRPGWDTAQTRARIFRDVQEEGLPFAADFPHALRAAVAYAADTLTEDKATEDRPAGSPRWLSVAFFAADGPHWKATR